MNTLPHIRLGDDMTSPCQGFGAMTLTGTYGESDPTESWRTINHAIDSGATLLDTADAYGRGDNERLLSSIVSSRRNEIVLATKFGIVPDAGRSQPRAQGDPAHVVQSVNASLTRLCTDVIDLYYYHRVDPRVDIEETVAALAGLVTAGKIRHIGLSEVTAGELERAHAIHPIAAVQSEWSIFSRDIEEHVLPTARRLGVGFVAYAPLGRGFLAGGITSTADLAPDDVRHRFPRFAEERLRSNHHLLAAIEGVAREAGATAAQVALAWLYGSAARSGTAVVPIPGTRKAEHVAENIAAIDLALSDESFATLDGLASQVHGMRNDDPMFVSFGREQHEPDPVAGLKYRTKELHDH